MVLCVVHSGRRKAVPEKEAMPTELFDIIQEATVVDTHEHMVKESDVGDLGIIYLSLECVNCPSTCNLGKAHVSRNQ